jgi:hypothetical protein
MDGKRLASTELLIVVATIGPKEAKFRWAEGVKFNRN